VLFSYRSARSAPLVIGIGIAILIETLVLHLALSARHPIAAWSLTALSAMTVAWLVRDYSALGTGAVRVAEGDVHLKVGHQFDVRVPLANVGRAITPSFRDLPRPGTNDGRDYLNLTRPASPNVLLVLDEPVKVRLPGGLHRTVRRLGMHLDEPSRFIEVLSTHEGYAAGR
jgi:hypothetical protein